MPLLEMAPEIQLLIAEQLRSPWVKCQRNSTNNRQLTKQADLKRLCEVSKALYQLLVPILYQSVTIQVDEWNLSNIPIDSLLHATTATTEPKDLLQHVRSLGLATSFYHYDNASRCPHNINDDIYYSADDDVDDEEYTYDDVDDGEYTYDRVSNMFQQLQPLFRQLKDNQLRSFAWAIGTCIPQALLGTFGFLALKQSHIESISLVTDPFCMKQEDDLCPISLSSFKHLKMLSWTGPRSEGDFVAISKALQNNSEHLVHFELDLARPDSTGGLEPWESSWHILRHDIMWSQEEISDQENFFTTQILPFPRVTQSNSLFPSLRKLSLSAISLLSVERTVLCIFDFSSLRFLSLRRCSGWAKLFSNIAQSKPQLKLDSLEIDITICDSGVDDVEDAIVTFLKSFTGLRELFVSVESNISLNLLWGATLNHQSTLSSFVHHELKLEFGRVPTTYWTKEPVPIPDLDDEANGLFMDLNLECFSCCCIPEYMKSIILPFKSKETLTVLHLRRSLHDRRVKSLGFKDKTDGQRADGSVPLTTRLQGFANWVFGPEGI